MIQNKRKQDEIQKQNGKLYDRLNIINKKNTNVSKLAEANEVARQHFIAQKKAQSLLSKHFVSRKEEEKVEKYYRSRS